MKDKALKKQVKYQRKKEKYLKKITLKPKLKREMIKSVIASLIIMALICGMVSYIVANKYSDYAYSLLTSENNDMHRKLAYAELNLKEGKVNAGEIEDEDALQREIIMPYEDTLYGDLNWIVDYPVFGYKGEFLEYLNWGLIYFMHSDLLEMPCFRVVYNSNGDVIADSSLDVYEIIVFGEIGDPDRKVYKCKLDFDAIDKAYPGLSKEIKDIIREGNYNFDENIRVDLGDIYYNGAYFMTNRLEINQVDYGYEDDETGVDIKTAPIIKNVKTFDLSKCDHSDMIKIDETDEKLSKMFSPIAIGANYSNPSRMYFEEYDKEKAREKVQQAAETGIIEADEEYFGPGVVRAVRFTSTSNDDLVSAVYIDIDFYRDMADVLIVFYLICAVIAIIVGLVIGYIMYGRKLLPYEMDGYRRRTTNAMAHDLKSPLMAISGYAENLKNISDNDKTLEYAENIIDSVKSMNMMISNILELSKLEDSKTRLDRTDVNIKNIVDECLINYQSMMAAKNMDVNISGEAKVLADANWMKHLVDNLVSNAVKYGKEGTKIDICISNEDMCIMNNFDYEMSVDKDKLLEPFVKGDSARTGAEGNGLGLGIAKNIVDMHGFIMNIDISEDKAFTVKIKF